MSVFRRQLAPLLRRPRPDIFLIVAATLAAFALRLWNLGDKALGYDEAATAIMARASLPEIVVFHWTAAFEHLPLWIMLIHAWSNLAGQSHFALRFLPALAGTLAVPLLWALLKRSAAAQVTWRQLAVLLAVTSPVLVLYAQEARMYTLVVMLALLSTYLWVRLCEKPTPGLIASYILATWAMGGFQYYSALLIGAHLLAALFLVRSASRHVFWVASLTAAAAVAPLLSWMALSPGFHETVQVVMREAQGPGLSPAAFLADIWKDLSFGAFRWQPEVSRIGLLTAPLMLFGMAAAFIDARTRSQTGNGVAARWFPLFFAIIAVPLIISAALLRTLAARYILYIVPFAYAFIAYAIVVLGRLHRFAALAAASVTLVVALTGLAHYYGLYHKSEYRDMSRYLLDHYSPAEDVVMIEAPRQHILAKYYMGQDFPLQPVPDIPLPDYWPLTAPPVVPDKIDDLVQDRLRDFSHLWLILSAEAEVDPGEFLPKYLSAVAYPQGCRAWLDVRLCRYISPGAVEPDFDAPLAVTFGGELSLEYARVSADARHALLGEGRPLFVELGWFAQTKPALDYKVTLRLVRADGTIVSQSDQFPIGMLLPPTTWSAGDRKAGYMALAIPDSAAPGVYTLELSVYDPATLIPIPYLNAGLDLSAPAPIILGLAEIDGTIRLRPASSAGT